MARIPDAFIDDRAPMAANHRVGRRAGARGSHPDTGVTPFAWARGD